jgi:hypothetical protein
MLATDARTVNQKKGDGEKCIGHASTNCVGKSNSGKTAADNRAPSSTGT